ncbi:MAG: single-stranded DNA-binding protein [Nanopusillaceae archaeon]
MNKVFLIGRVGKNPEMRIYEGGNKKAWITLATSKRYKQDGNLIEKTEWHFVVFWGGLADWCYENLKKGDLLFIEGEITYYGKSKEAQIIARNVKRLIKKINDTQESLDETPNLNQEPLEGDLPEDLPF